MGKAQCLIKELKKFMKGTGLEVHHLLEKRFLKNSVFDKVNIKANEIMSVAIEKELHEKIIKLMRQKAHIEY